MDVWQRFQRGEGRDRIVPEQLAQRGRRVEARDFPRALLPVSAVVNPNQLAVRGVQERRTEAAEVEPGWRQRPCVPLGLRQYASRADRNALRLDDADDLTIEA